MKILTTVKKIVSKKGDLHFRRFAIIETKYFSIYIHKICRADEDLHLHDHPWDYTSIVLDGTYVEQTKKGTEMMMPGCVAMRKAEHTHKILRVWSNTTTLFFTGKRRREWGYDTENGWVDNVTYRKQKNKQ